MRVWEHLGGIMRHQFQWVGQWPHLCIPDNLLPILDKSIEGTSPLNECLNLAIFFLLPYCPSMDCIHPMSKEIKPIYDNIRQWQNINYPKLTSGNSIWSGFYQLFYYQALAFRTQKSWRFILLRRLVFSASMMRNHWIHQLK